MIITVYQIVIDKDCRLKPAKVGKDYHTESLVVSCLASDFTYLTQLPAPMHRGS